MAKLNTKKAVIKFSCAALAILAVTMLVAYLSLREKPPTYDYLNEYSPERILEEFISALENGDNELLSHLYSAQRLSGSFVTPFAPQKIGNVTIREQTGEDNSLGIIPRNDSLEANYVLSFKILNENPYFDNTYFFAKLVFEDKCWKIDVLATSP